MLSSIDYYFSNGQQKRKDSLRGLVKEGHQVCRYCRALTYEKDWTMEGGCASVDVRDLSAVCYLCFFCFGSRALEVSAVAIPLIFLNSQGQRKLSSIDFGRKHLSCSMAISR